eukprot:CFRG6306T1
MHSTSRADTSDTLYRHRPLPHIMSSTANRMHRGIRSYLDPLNNYTTISMGDSHTSSNESVVMSRYTNSHRSQPDSQFQTKIVREIFCGYCDSFLSRRGMRAILLGDTNVELYSTDVAPKNSVGLIGDDYVTKNCNCKIKDIACLCCGNVMGYHVTSPCSSCLQASHNGHFWMFHSEGLKCRDRKDPQSKATMMWGSIPNQIVDDKLPYETYMEADDLAVITDGIECIR